MANVLAELAQAGGNHERFAVIKGVARKTKDGGERLHVVCMRATRADAQQLADRFETAQRYVMFLEYLSAVEVEHGGSAELATVDNPTVYAAFLTKFHFNDEGQIRLYNVQVIRVVTELDDNGEEAIPAAPATESK